MKTNKITEVSKKYSKDKLVINSITDLLKLPINKINNSKIENFSGIYFDKLYEEAIKSETQTETEESSPTKKLKRKKSIKHKSNKKIQKLIKSNSIDSKKQYAEENDYDYEYIRTNEQKINNEIKIELNIKASKRKIKKKSIQKMMIHKIMIWIQKEMNYI